MDCTSTGDGGARASSLSRKKRVGVRCETSPDDSHTSPCYSPPRRGDPHPANRRGAATLFRLIALCLAACVAIAPASALDLTKKRATLPDLVLGNEEGNDYVVENRDIELESGKAYRLRIVAKGRQEYKFYATEFFRNIWINQIVIQHIEIHGSGPPDHFEFDDPGEIAIEFVTIRPGEYPWTVRGLEAKGMAGKFVVK